MAYIINQYHGGFFDEHKVMLDFYDKEQAINAYRLTTGNTPEIFSCTMQQLKWWLQFGNHAAPVTAQSFPFDNENENMMTQGFNTNWTDKTAAQFIYEMRKTDEYGELTEAATLDAICFDEEQDGAQIEFQAAFDALAVENKRLEKTAQLLGLALNRTSGSLKVVENGIQISAPMKKNGTTNIAVMYEMTDGQTVSVLFHNPDTTPAKIAPDDVLISWKWLLNRKDITIVVAKENGKDLPLPTVARRVMALVEKNTARFAKANANKAAETEELARLESEKAQKLARLEELNAQLVAKQNKLPENKTAPIEVTGNEFVHSSLDMTNPENKKKLREEVRDYLKDMAGLKGIFIHNKALDEDVLLSSRGIAEMMNYSGDARKLNLLKNIKQIIETAKPENGQAQMLANEKKAKKPHAIGYYHFMNEAVIDGKMVKFRVIFEVDKDGVLHYDVIIPKNKTATMDSLSNSPTITNRGIELEPHATVGNNHTATFDDVSSISDGYVLNLFVFDENGNEIDDVQDVANSGSLKTEPLDESALEPLNVPENATAKEVRKALETYLKQLQGKTITTSDGKTVRFSGKSTGHITNDIMQRENGLALQAAEFAVEVLKTGQFIERQELYKAREKDGFVAFHTYRKWVELKDGTKMNLQVKAGELQNGLLVAGDGLIAYAMKNAEKIKEAENNPTSFTGDSANDVSGISQLPHRPTVQVEPTSTSQCNNHTAIYDAAQDNEPYIFIEILEVREKNSGSLKDEKKPLVNSNIPLTADKATFDEAENFVQTYFDDLNSEQAEILKNWLAENRLPDFLNEGKTSHYQALADYLGQEIINGIRNPKRFHDKNGNISLSKLRKFFLFENARKSGILNELNKNANELTGQELGNFDLSNTESVKQLHQATREHLERLRGKWIFNHHLDADIEIRQRGIDEMIRYSANPVKLQILANIENLIATAKSVGSGFEVNGKQAEKPHIAHYFRLWNTSKVNGESFPIQIVIEQDEKGLLHYDVVLTDEQKAVLDSTRTPSSKSWNVVPNQNDYALDDIDSDNESQGDNLNLFVFNLAGNELKTNEDFQEYADYLASDRESQKLINESKQKFDEQKAERERQMAQEKAELDAQNTIIKEWIASENMSVRDAGLVLKVLNKKVDFLGKIQTTAQHIEEIIKLKNGVVRNGTMEKYSRKLDEYIDVETVTLWDSDNKGYALETKSEQNFARYLEKKFKNSGSLNSENSSQDVQDIQEFTIKNPDGTFSRALILEELDKILSKLKDDGTGMAKYSYTGSVVPLSVVKRDMKKKFEEFLDVFASEPEKALRLTQKMVDKYNNAPVSPKQNEEPQEIDVSAIDTDLSKYQNADDESFKESVGRVLNQLQGKYVNTQIGKVLFNAVSVGELKLGTKENKIRASLIPFVPETLQNGTYLGKFELAKDRSGKKGKFVAFHNFGNTVVVDNKEINHVVKVGERENGEFVFIAYHSRAVMDSTNEKETVSAPDTVSNIKAGRSEAETISMNAILRKKAYGVNGVFDDIEDGKDGWNIEIISIRELNSVETIEIENSTVPELVGENGNNPQSPIGLHGANENNPTQTPPDSQDDVANRLKEKLSQIGFTEKNEDDQTSEDENVQKAREFANELIAKKYSLQQILDGEIDDKLDWLLYLDGSEYEDLAHDAMKAYAELF